jgi:hypothetical protein
MQLCTESDRCVLTYCRDLFSGLLNISSSLGTIVLFISSWRWCPDPRLGYVHFILRLPIYPSQGSLSIFYVLCRAANIFLVGIGCSVLVYWPVVCTWRARHHRCLGLDIPQIPCVCLRVGIFASSPCVCVCYPHSAKRCQTIMTQLSYLRNLSPSEIQTRRRDPPVLPQAQAIHAQFTHSDRRPPPPTPRIHLDIIRCSPPPGFERG